MPWADDNLPSIQNTKASPIMIFGVFIIALPFIGNAFGWDIPSFVVWFGIVFLILGIFFSMEKF